MQALTSDNTSNIHDGICNINCMEMTLGGKRLLKHEVILSG